MHETVSTHACKQSESMRAKRNNVCVCNSERMRKMPIETLVAQSMRNSCMVCIAASRGPNYTMILSSKVPPRRQQARWCLATVTLMEHNSDSDPIQSSVRSRAVRKSGKKI
eukprot:2521396-Amphidinium_carterae.2